MATEERSLICTVGRVLCALYAIRLSIAKGIHYKEMEV